MMIFLASHIWYSPSDIQAKKSDGEYGHVDLVFGPNLLVAMGKFYNGKGSVGSKITEEMVGRSIIWRVCSYMETLGELHILGCGDTSPSHASSVNSSLIICSHDSRAR